MERMPVTGSARRLLPEPDYRHLAGRIYFDEASPVLPEQLASTAAGNMFDVDDRPTLSGKLVASMYASLIERPRGSVVKPAAPIVIEKGRRARQDFIDYVTHKNSQRAARHCPPLPCETNYRSGTDMFHLGGDSGVARSHIFYFNKSHAHWKRESPIEIRGYITLSPEESQDLQRLFVDLVLRLYHAGIDFTAKASSPNGVYSRTDNIVLYISVYDQPRASEIIKAFLQEKRIGHGSVYAAIASSQPGLSWALEPTHEEQVLWKHISGSSLPTSFNGFVAARLTPFLLERLMRLHEKRGNTAATAVFRREKERIDVLLRKHGSEV